MAKTLVHRQAQRYWSIVFPHHHSHQWYKCHIAHCVRHSRQAFSVGTPTMQITWRNRRNQRRHSPFYWKRVNATLAVFTRVVTHGNACAIGRKHVVVVAMRTIVTMNNLALFLGKVKPIQSAKTVIHNFFAVWFPVRSFGKRINHPYSLYRCGCKIVYIENTSHITIFKLFWFFERFHGISILFVNYLSPSWVCCHICFFYFAIYRSKHSHLKRVDSSAAFCTASTEFLSPYIS